ELERAVAWNDVDRGSPVNHADVQRRVRNIVGRILALAFAIGPRAPRDPGDEIAADLHRIHALRGERRMRFVSAHAAAPRLAALVGDDELHAGRLADDAAGWRNTARDDVGDQPAHADAADFLVVRQREMQWPRKPAAEELRNEREADRAEALHVGDAAPVQAIAGERRFERIRVPRLPVDV